MHTPACATTVLATQWEDKRRRFNGGGAAGVLERSSLYALLKMQHIFVFWMGEVYQDVFYNREAEVIPLIVVHVEREIANPNTSMAGMASHHQ
jgi:hypothetical protein